MKTWLRCLLMLFMWIPASGVMAQTARWQDVYKVKKKDSLKGIAQKYGLTEEELKKANPEMEKEGYLLKKGEFVLIPYPKTDEEKTLQVGASQSPSEQGIRSRSIRVGVMLPLHDVDGDGRRMIEYYRGMLLACEDLKAEGIPMEVYAWNVSADSDIRQTLLDNHANTCDVIYGPLYTKQVKNLGNFCQTYDIKMVIPFSINGDEMMVNDHVYQVYQTPQQLNEKGIEAFLERFPETHVVFVDCNDSTSRKGSFTTELRRRLEMQGRKYNITNLKSSDENFAKAFSATLPNVVVLNTGRSPELNASFAKLNIMKNSHPSIAVSMYGYTEWLMYTKVYKEYYHRYNIYIPTVAYYNALAPNTQKLENSYRKWFKKDMQYALPRFAITGYDQLQFFVRGLYERGKKFHGEKGTSSYKPLQTPLKFKRVGDGGYQNENFMLIHYTREGGIEAVNY